MPPEIRKMLVLSTAHIPASGLRPDVSGCDPTRYGGLLWVPDDPVGECGDDDAPGVLAVRMHARKLGCDYILFDADGPIESDVPTYEHEPAPIRLRECRNCTRPLDAQGECRAGCSQVETHECDECRATIPAEGTSMLNRYHAYTCSMHGEGE